MASMRSCCSRICSFWIWIWRDCASRSSRSCCSSLSRPDVAAVFPGVAGSDLDADGDASLSLSVAVELSAAAVLLDFAAVLSLSLSPAEPVAAIAGAATRPRANRYATNARITSSLKFDCHVFPNDGNRDLKPQLAKLFDTIPQPIAPERTVLMRIPIHQSC